MSSIFAQQTGRSGQLFGAMRSLLVPRHGAGFHAAATTITTTTPMTTSPNKHDGDRQRRSPISTALRLPNDVIRPMSTAMLMCSDMRLPVRSDGVAGSWATWRTTAQRQYSADATRKPADAPKEASKGDAKSQQAFGVSKPDESPLPTSASAAAGDAVDDNLPAAKPGIIAQFKDLYKRYWYVMVPVHVVTSTGWMVGFYYLSASGVDVPELLRSFDISDSIVSRFEQSKMGHLAIAYLCYKIATPVRYAVTVGGTTVSIKYLSQWGYIKPIPSNERLREIYADRKAQMKDGYAEIRSKASDALHGPKEDK